MIPYPIWYQHEYFIAEDCIHDIQSVPRGKTTKNITRHNNFLMDTSSGQIKCSVYISEHPKRKVMESYKLKSTDTSSLLFKMKNKIQKVKITDFSYGLL